MTMPGEVLSGDPAVGEILSPDDRFSYNCPWIDYERGGVAVGDPSQGHDVQTWRLRGIPASPPSKPLTPCFRYDGQRVGSWNGLVLDVPDNPGIALRRLWPVANVREVSLAFDQNMRPAAAFMDGSLAKLYWYDSTQQRSVVLDFPGMQSPRLCLDDKRVTQTASSDILLIYIDRWAVRMRRQRDRFQQEYILKRDSGVRRLGRVGMGSNWRLHIELVYDNGDPGEPWYPKPLCAPGE